MTKHVFGGDWTSEKLDRVRKYLSAYTRIFTANPRAQYFSTTYVDAFAGTGYRSDSSPTTGDAALFYSPDQEAEQFKKGSARIALEISPPFNNYVFVEQSPERAKELEKLKDEFVARASSIKIRTGEANTFLQNWCRQTKWLSNRAVVFLDPYGMSVEWTTLEAIAKTKAIDLWILFPLGVAVNRLLTREKRPPQAWADALTRIFGGMEWETIFYPTRKELTLFGAEPRQRREVELAEVGEFFVNRLKTIFAGVAENPLPLLNSMKMPIYLLCFAAGNPRGAKTAVKIAQDILHE